MEQMNVTHKVSLYGVPCYIDLDNGYITGTNIVADWFIPVMLHLHNFVAMCFPGFGEGGFPIRILEQYEKVYSTDDHKDS